MKGCDHGAGSLEEPTESGMRNGFYRPDENKVPSQFNFVIQSLQ
jgi:hypothetical protein